MAPDVIAISGAGGRSALRIKIGVRLLSPLYSVEHLLTVNLEWSTISIEYSGQNAGANPVCGCLTRRGIMSITLGLSRNQGSDASDRPSSNPAPVRMLKMLERLGAWAATRADRIKDIFLVRVENSVALYLITHAEAYDFVLGRELAEFAGPYIARGVFDDATLIPASSPEELDAFFDKKHAFRITFE